jgi:hypothetical protein
LTLLNTSAHGQVNAVIHAFNHYSDPATQRLPLQPYQLSTNELPPVGPPKLLLKKPATKPEPVPSEKEEGEVGTDADGEEEDAPDKESTKLSPSMGKKRKRNGAK